MVARAPSAKFLPFRTVSDWLDAETAADLLSYATENEDRFEAAPVLYKGRSIIDVTHRQASRLRTLGRFGEPLAERAMALKPELERAFGIPAFAPKEFEMELVAHGEGAHFQRHIDTFVVQSRTAVARSRVAMPRLLTLVLYLNRCPKRYSGGELRFYALGSDRTVDVVPEHNLLVAFPSIAPHSIEPVSCAGGFGDRRFAVNIWIHG